MKVILNLLMITCLVTLVQISKAQEKIVGVWINAEKTGKMQIYKGKNGLFYGKIIWLASPNDPSGKPKKDLKNPDQSQKLKPLIGLVNLKNFKKTADSKYEEGSIYDPKNGKTYSCKLQLKDHNTLDVRGYMGISLIGRTTTFSRVN